MKTIEEKSSEYMSTVTCAETDNLGAKHIAKRAFMAGAQEAQRWFLPDKEPPHKEAILARLPNLNHPIVAAYNQLEKKWYQFDGSDFYLLEITPIEWRPIERKYQHFKK